MVVKVRLSILALFIVLSSFFQVVSADTTPPTISDLDYTPRIPTAEDTVTVTAVVVDDASGVDFVNLYYSVNGSAWNAVSMSSSGSSSFSGVIPNSSSGSSIQFKVFAQDNMGNPVESDVISYVVTVYVSPVGLVFFMYILGSVIAGGLVLTFLLLRVKPVVKCPSCGYKIKPVADFCPNCGKKIK